MMHEDTRYGFYSDIAVVVFEAMLTLLALFSHVCTSLTGKPHSRSCVPRRLFAGTPYGRSELNLCWPRSPNPPCTVGQCVECACSKGCHRNPRGQPFFFDSAQNLALRELEDTRGDGRSNETFFYFVLSYVADNFCR